MISDKTVLYYGRGRLDPSSLVSDFAAENELEVVSIEQSAEVCVLLNRIMPACLILETSDQNAEVFEEESDKAWKEYVEQVGAEMAVGAGQEFWGEALNDALAKGESIF